MGNSLKRGMEDNSKSPPGEVEFCIGTNCLCRKLCHLLQSGKEEDELVKTLVDKIKPNEKHFDDKWTPFQCCARWCYQKDPRGTLDVLRLQFKDKEEAQQHINEFIQRWQDQWEQREHYEQDNATEESRLLSGCSVGGASSNRSNNNNNSNSCTGNDNLLEFQTGEEQDVGLMTLGRKLYRSNLAEPLPGSSRLTFDPNSRRERSNSNNRPDPNRAVQCLFADLPEEAKGEIVAALSGNDQIYHCLGDELVKRDCLGSGKWEGMKDKQASDDNSMKARMRNMFVNAQTLTLEVLYESLTKIKEPRKAQVVLLCFAEKVLHMPKNVLQGYTTWWNSNNGVVDVKRLQNGGEQARVTFEKFQNATWMLDGWSAAQAVCKVKVAEGRTGTGFLVGQNLVLTCFHVFTNGYEVANVATVKERAQSEGTRVTFQVHKGAAFTFFEARACAWDGVVAQPNTGVEEVSEGHLDFVLFKISKVPDSAVPVVFKSPFLDGTTCVNIVHFPDQADVMKLSMRQNNLLETPKRTDLSFKYRTDTEPGSSGAPVFNDDWEWLGMHRYGEKGQFNSAVKASVIFKLIQNNTKNNNKQADDFDADIQQAIIRSNADDLGTQNTSNNNKNSNNNNNNK